MTDQMESSSTELTTTEYTYDTAGCNNVTASQSYTTDTHSGLVSFAEVSQVLCDQLLDINQTLQSTFDELQLKSAAELDELKAVLLATNTFLRDNATPVNKIVQTTIVLRDTLETMNKNINAKLREEQLMPWIDKSILHQMDEVALVAHQSSHAKQSALEASLAVTRTEVLKAQELALEFEKKAYAAQQEAETAIARAERAAKVAEEARMAEESRRLAAAEAAKRKAIEEEKLAKEKKRQEEEERERQRKLQKSQSGKSEEQLEKERRERELNDPKNWRMYIYSIDPGDLDLPLGCVVRAKPDSVDDRDCLTLTRLEQLDGAIALETNEELVGHIVRLSATDNSELTFSPPMSVALPHCAPRNVPSREPVIKGMTSNGDWTELVSNEVVFEDIKEYKFVEARIDALPISLAVVTRLKRESFVISKQGGKICSSVDNRLSMIFKRNTFSKNESIKLEVQPIDMAIINELKYRICSDLVATSPITTCTLKTCDTYRQPMTMSVPVPAGGGVRNRRPNTAAHIDSRPSQESVNARPKSAFAFNRKEDEMDDYLVLMALNKNSRWECLPDVDIKQMNNKDIVNFDMEIETHKLLVIRLSIPADKPELVKICEALEAALCERAVRFIIRQVAERRQCVIAQCVTSARTDRALQKLADDNYAYGPPASGHIVLHEGTVVRISFRGNIDAIDENSDSLRLVFNSHVPSQLKFTVREKEKFAQRSIDFYRGFAQFYVSNDSGSVNEADAASLDYCLLCELLIGLPKPDPSSLQPTVHRARVQVKTHGLIDGSLLQHLASELGEEWRRLAQYLDIRSGRIQAILRSNAHGEPEHTIYSMLLTWMKKVPRGVNKVDILCRALMYAGRADLAESIRDKELDYKHERARTCRESHLRLAFAQIIQDMHVVSDWRGLAVQLGVSGSELDTIEGQYAGTHLRCYHSLLRWSATSGHNATIEHLASRLRKRKHRQIADQVSSIIK